MHALEQVVLDDMRMQAELALSRWLNAIRGRRIILFALVFYTMRRVFGPFFCSRVVDPRAAGP